MKLNFSRVILLLTVVGALSSVLLVSCGGSGAAGGSQASGSPASGVANDLVATAVGNGAPLSSCPNNGVTVKSGIDTNGNRVLDPSEVTTTQYVCYDTAASSALSTLVAVSDEPAGSNCQKGGARVSAGLDSDSSSILTASKIKSTGFVCGGHPSHDGHDQHVYIVPIPPIALGGSLTDACLGVGGIQVFVGKNTSGNGSFSSSNATQSYVVCNGAQGPQGQQGPQGPQGPAGPGITWVDVTAASGVVAAAVNKGYLADGSAQVTIRLPYACTVGDLVQVSGIGAGGWKVAQNPGPTALSPKQFIETKNLAGSYGALWTARESNRNWTSVASSSNGTYMIAASSGNATPDGVLVRSSDSGATWSEVTGPNVSPSFLRRNWTAVASSGTGQYMIAAVSGGQLFLSSNYGSADPIGHTTTWTAVNGGAPVSANWSSVASSTSGQYMVAAINSGQIYTSTDYGVTWTVLSAAPSGNWTSVALSSDGTKLLAANRGVALYAFTYAVGPGWTMAHMASIAQPWATVAASADGSKLVAAANMGQIYTSTDFGVSWTARETSRYWMSVASSADGTKLVAAANTSGGQIYTSTDSGLTWMPRESVRSWQAVASSADGTVLIAAVSGGQLYTSAQTTTPGFTGYISGGQYDSLDLQCIGSPNFMVRGFSGALVVK